MTQGFDIDELERALARSKAEPEDLEDQGFWTEARVITIFPDMIAEIRELRAANARLRGHWSALDKALADNIIETDQPHRVRWEGEWHYGPLADAYFAMTSVVRKLARAALGEHQ